MIWARGHKSDWDFFASEAKDPGWGARTCGVPTFENPNGRMMEGDGGAAITDLRVRDGRRQSVFRSCVPLDGPPQP